MNQSYQTEQENLDTAIHEMANMINQARLMIEAGELVELDLISMRIAVLCDAIISLPLEKSRNLLSKLEAIMTEINRLEYILRRRNVDLSLELQLADRRLRAKLAYNTKIEESSNSSMIGN